MRTSNMNCKIDMQNIGRVEEAVGLFRAFHVTHMRHRHNGSLFVWLTAVYRVSGPGASPLRCIGTLVQTILIFGFPAAQAA